MRTNDELKIFELFDGLNMLDLVGNAHLDLYDCREVLWRKMTKNLVVLEVEGKLEYMSISNDFLENPTTKNILMLAEDEGKGFVLILNGFNYDEELRLL